MGSPAQRGMSENRLASRFFLDLLWILSGISILASSSPAPSPESHRNTTTALSPGDKLSSSSAPSLSEASTAGFWDPTSALQLARQDFQALLLVGGPLKGQILAVGGCCNGSSSLASSEIFVPQNNTWHATGDLRAARWLFRAVALPNGSALAMGGLSIAEGGVQNSTELFIPAQDGSPIGVWKQVSGMNTPRQDFAAVLLDDGTVLAVGGFMASAEIYNPSQDQWTQTSRMSMNDARSAFQVVKLSSGKVLAVGGMGRDSSVLSSSELFDPSTQMWTKQGQLTNGRAYFSLVLMSDGRVLAAGGIGNTGAILNTSEIYDPQTGTWSVAPDMTSHRSQHQAIRLPSGIILVVGGLGGSNDKDAAILDTAEMYDPSGNVWDSTDPLINARYVFQLVSLANSTVMAVGGTGRQGFTSSAELFQTF